MPTSRRARIASIAVVVPALAVRLLYLLRRPLWFDETFTVWISRRSPAGVAATLRLDSGPPLFYWIEHPFVRLSDLSGAASLARVVSYLAAAALFAAAARSETSGGPRFVVLLAASPSIFFYSGEARAYAALAVLSFFLFAATVRMPDGRRTIVLAATCAALLPWIHYLGALVVAGSIAVSATRRRWRLAAAQAAGGLPFFLLWLPVALRQPAAAISWVQEGWRVAVPGALGALGFWFRPPAYFSGAPVPVPWAGALLGAAIIGGTVLVARCDRDVRAALAFAAAPLLLAAAAGVWRPIYLSGRTEVAVLPVALWAFARAARTSAAVRLLTSASAALGGMLILASLFSIPAPPPYAVTAEYVSRTARTGDLVVASDADYLPLLERADRNAPAARLVGIPAEIERHPGWFEPGNVVAPERERSRLRDALRTVAAGRRVFFAVPPDPAAREIVVPFLRGQRGRIVRPPGGDPVMVVGR